MNIKNKNQFPTQKDWDNIMKNNDDYDLKYAYEHLYGKTIDDIKKESFPAHIYMDDVSCLTGSPFYYYMLIAMNLIREKFFKDLGGAQLSAIYFFSIIRRRYEQEGTFPKYFIHEVKVTAEFILKNKQYFEINKSALVDYGDQQSTLLRENISYIKKIVQDI